jgi:polysaccharide biosynthesis transport protein
MLGVGLALFVEYLDTSIKTMDDIENFLDLPVLAVVPKGIRMLTGVSEDSPDAEAYRLLSTNLEFRWEKDAAGARTISIVSGTAGEGKSTTACNLAITFVVRRSLGSAMRRSLRIWSTHACSLSSIAGFRARCCFA